MSSHPRVGQSSSRTSCDHSRSSTPLLSIDEYSTAFKSWLSFDQDQNHAETRPTTTPTSHQPSDGSETTGLGRCYDSGTFDAAPSVTLRDTFLWHGVGVNKSTQRLPSTIVPALLQGVSDVSPSSRSTSDRAQGELREVDENNNPGDVSPRYSAAQKGKWKARTDNEIVHDTHCVRSESPEFHFPPMHNSVEDWVIHNRPILQDYANRQTSLPLGRRLEVSIDEPSKFILGVLQLLVNRDKNNCTDRSRQIGPQLIENFVDIDRWTKEYFRSRHGAQLVDSDVPTLLTIVLNNFYEGQVQLIDRLVEFALENMHISGRSNLNVEDFAFGFDFRMSQDLPFYVETSSQLREPLPIRTVDMCSTVEPVTTGYGRQVKPTKRAQEAAKQTQKNVTGGRNRRKGVPHVDAKFAASGSVPLVSQKKKSSVQPPSDRTVPEVVHVAPAPPKTIPARANHRPVRPSNLRLPPVLSDSPAPETTLSQLADSFKSKPSESALANDPEVSGASGSNPKHRSSQSLKVKLPTNFIAPATSDPGSTSNNSNGTTDVSNAPIQTRVTRSSVRTRPAGPRGHGHGHGCGRGRGCGAEPLTLSAETAGATPVNADVLSTAPAVGASDAIAPAPFNSPVAPPAPPTTPVDNALRSPAGTFPSARPRCTENTTGQLLPPPPDPGHSQRKKRKLDDCDD